MQILDPQSLSHVDFILGKIALMFAQLPGAYAVKETLSYLLTGTKYSMNP